MKNRTLIVAALVMVLLCVGLIFLGLRHENAGGGSPGQSQTADGDTQSQAQQDITATLAVCGDIMSHLPQTNDAYDAATDTYSYLPCFQYAKAWTESADYTVGNLETTLNGPPYSGYPQFCAPDALAYNLKSIGFDLVTTANNHCMDKGYNGLSRTLDVLDQAELKHVGTYRTQAEFDENHGVVVADVGGISVAFLGYTYGTNGIPVAADKDFSLNRFNVDYTGDCATLDQEKLSSELAYAESLNTDLIAVMIHWGIEYQTTQNAYQEQVADFLISHGADVILGSHSHVPQPMGHPGRRLHPDGLRGLLPGQLRLQPKPRDGERELHRHHCHSPPGADQEQPDPGDHRHRRELCPHAGPQPRDRGPGSVSHPGCERPHSRPRQR